MKINAWKIHCDTSTGLTRFDVALFKLFNQCLILGDFGALLIDCFLLVSLLHLLTLELITDQCAGAQSQRASDCRTDPWVTYGRTNGPSRGRTSQGTNSRAFLSSAERAARTPRSQDQQNSN